MNITSFFLCTYHVIIDRIEDDFAIVEWHNDRLSIIPVDEFTDPPHEGDHYLLQLHRFSGTQCQLLNNDPIVIQCAERSLVLPQSIFWRENTYLSWQLQPIQPKEKSQEQYVYQYLK